MDCEEKKQEPVSLAVEYSMFLTCFFPTNSGSIPCVRSMVPVSLPTFGASDLFLLDVLIRFGTCSNSIMSWQINTKYVPQQGLLVG